MGGAFFGVNIASEYLCNRLNEMFIKFGDSLSISIIRKCYSEASFTHMIYYASMPLIVVHEVLLYPVFYRCFPQLKGLQKVIIGMLLQLIRILILMVYEIISRHNYQNVNINKTIPCLFYANQGTLSTSFNYHWMAIPDFIVSISLMMFYIGAMEYISAQVPYFMKGLAFGTAYSSLLLSGTVWFILIIPLNKKMLYASLTNIWGESCGFWYTLTLTTTCASMCVIMVIFTRCYKKRQRQDVLPNEHIFAERFYSRRL